MSMSTWITHGYGFCVNDIETTPEKVLKLAALDADTLKEVEDYLNECFPEGYDIKDLTMNDFDNLEGIYGETGLAYILPSVIKEFNSCFASDEAFGGYILYCPCYPWELPETEKDITEDYLKETFQKYISILTDKKIEIDYQSAEVWG